MKLGKSSLNDIAKLRPDSTKRRRVSSYDETGDNYDWIDLKPGETAVLADVKGAGSITHIWCTCMCIRVKYSMRNAILRMYWDGEDTPSVEVPFGDFFCVPQCTIKRFASLMMAGNLGAGAEQENNGYNCYFRMPFNNGARVTLENQSTRSVGGGLS